MKGKFGKLVMSAAMSLSCAMSVTVPVAAEEAEKDYEIYPVPHDTDYNGGSFVIRSKVNVVFEDGIDSYTQDKLLAVLSDNGLSASISNAPVTGATNIMVGLKDSAGVVDTYVQNNTKGDLSVFEDRITPYILDVNNGNITILGSDTDAAYYGVVSLMHILNQLDGKTIRNLDISDYADTQTRGFIEGYYGVPWSYEDRISLMHFGGDFKMTSYVFAPKDDPYHKEKWRELYPESELDNLRAMVEAGRESKCRFVWTAHPFMGGFNSSDVDGEIDALLNKFEQLYDLGVRQFGVLGDDVGSLSTSVVSQMMNAVSEWGEEKGDVYDPVFCPAGYNHSWQGNYSELNYYDTNFPENVQIFWTGEAVCQPVEQITLDHFRTYNNTTGKEKRRAPLFWLNWPVNDVNHSRLEMGKGSRLHTDVNPEDLNGVVTNPMQEAEASKTALFAVSDYTWNVADFDEDKSWADSFDYIDKQAPEELHTLAKHMSDPSPNGHGMVLEESEELAPLFADFNAKNAAGSLTDEDYENLINEFQIISDAVDGFYAKSLNENLKDEIRPHTLNLQEQAQAAIELLKAKQALESGNSDQVWSHYAAGADLFAKSKTHTKQGLDNVYTVAVGAKRITPFVKALNDELGPAVSGMLDDSVVTTRIISSRSDMPDNALELLTDGSTSSEVILKSPNSTVAGDYIGITWSKLKKLNNVTFYMGQSSNMRDTFSDGKLQVTEDGHNWTDLEGTEFSDTSAEVKAEGLDLEVYGVRIISTKDKTNMWLGIREIAINEGEQPTTNVVEGSSIYNEENMSVRLGSAAGMTDGDTSTYAHLAKGPYEGDDRDTMPADAWVGIDFGEVKKVDAITITQDSGDKIAKGVLEYTTDGETWQTLKTLDTVDAVVSEQFDEIEAKAIRLRNTEATAKWWKVFEIKATYGEEPEQPAEESVRYDATGIYSSRFGIYSGSVANITDGNDSTNVWFNQNLQTGDYVGIDLGEPKVIGNVRFVQDSGDCMAEYTLQYSNDNENWTDIDTYTDIPLEIDLSRENITARYLRAVATNNFGKWLKVFSFEAYSPTKNTWNVITNITDLEHNGASVSEEQAALMPVENVTLQPGQYIGLKLNRLREVTSISATAPAGLTLQYSSNGVVWSDAEGTSVTNPGNVRYARVINDTAAAVTGTVEALVIQSRELFPISVAETNFGSGSTHLNAFDKDRTTEAIWQGSQEEGRFITYDLGQMLHLESLKMVLHDGTTDFPRHGKVMVSADGENWTDVLVIGSQDAANPGEAEDEDNIADLFPNHEISYYTLAAEGLDQDIRFIKFEITRTKEGADKWVRVREIELNGNDYFLRPANDPTIESDSASESDGNLFTNMIDGSVSSAYTPAEEAGSFTYHVTENTKVGRITILQSPSALSSATVTVKGLKNGEEKTAELGTLCASMNEFSTADFDHVFDITVTWDGIAPSINEFFLSTTKPAAADKTALEQSIARAEAFDKDALTPSTKAALEEALVAAKAVQAGSAVTQTMVDSAVAALEQAMAHSAVPGDQAAYKTALDALEASVLSEENYLSRTWMPYQSALNTARQAQDNADMTQSDLDALLEAVQAAADALVYELSSIENLRVLAEDAAAVDGSVYTAESYAAVETALAAANEIIAADAEERVAPSAVKAAAEALQTALDGLEEKKPDVPVEEANKALLNRAIAYAKTQKEAPEYEHVNEIVKNFFENALAEAETIAADEKATQEDVDAAWVKLTDAIHYLSFTSDKGALGVLIAECDEIAANLDAYEGDKDEFNAALAEAKAVMDSDTALDEQSIKAAYDRLAAAKAGLSPVVPEIDTTVLETLVKESQKTEAELDKYIETGKAEFTAALRAGEAVLAAPESQKQVDEAASTLHAALLNLRLKADESIVRDLQNFIAEVEAADPENFTEEEWNTIQAAYDKAVAAVELAAKGDLPADVADEVKADADAARDILRRVDKSELRDLHNSLKGLNAEDYESGWEEFAAAHEHAGNILDKEDATQEEVDAAYDRLHNAHQNLVPVTEKDFSKLDAALARAEALKADKDKYTPETWSAVEIQVKAAQAVKELGNKADQNAINSEADALNRALDALEEKPVVPVINTDALQAAIEKAEAVKTEDYTDESVAAMNEKLAAAKDVLANPESQDAVDKAAKALEDAVAALEKKQTPKPEEKADKSDLEEEVKKAEAIDQKKYTDETAKKLQTAIDAAKKVLADDKASQTQVDKALKDLQAAMKALKSKPGTPSKTDGTPTAAAMGTAGFLTAMGAAGVAFVAALRRRRNK